MTRTQICMTVIAIQMLAGEGAEAQASLQAVDRRSLDEAVPLP